MKCPSVDCSAVLRFKDLAYEEREFFLNNIERYQI
jgi:hypothetical protein